MLLTIYDKAGNKRADVAVNDSSTQSKEVQGDNVLPCRSAIMPSCPWM